MRLMTCTAMTEIIRKKLVPGPFWIFHTVSGNEANVAKVSGLSYGIGTIKIQVFVVLLTEYSPEGKSLCSLEQLFTL